MSFFGGGGQKVKPQYNGIQLQTSSSVAPIPLVWGMQRISPNILWYADFKSHKQKQKAGKGGGSVTSYTYSASIILGLCQGPINGIGRVFRNQEKASTPSALGFSTFLGASGQAPWGYLTSQHPAQALSYSNVAYVAAANYDLGQSASTPQHNFEVRGMRYNTGPLLDGDSDVTLCIQDLLTDGGFGAGFAPEIIDNDCLYSGPDATSTGDSSMQTYCRALGIGISPALTEQETAGSILDRWTLIANTAIVWTGYSLKFIPYGTDETTGHGYHFVPNVTAVYNLNDDDYVSERGEPPVYVTRSAPEDADNSIKLTIKNRSNEYNDAPAEWKDQGLIDLNGDRPGNTITASEVTNLETAALVVSLYGQRLAYTRNEYEFILPSSFILLEPMDILTVEDPLLGVVSIHVDRMEEEEDTFNIRITGKEIPPGIGKAAEGQDVSNDPVNRATPPGPVNLPLILQPPLSLTDGVAQMWAAVSGGDGTTGNPYWGGAFVYVSTDGITYQQIGTIEEAARQGILSEELPDYTGSNPDATHTLSVDLSMSLGDLQSTTLEEAERFATLCYVDGEFLSFTSATLTGDFEYDLTSLYRGAYRTAINPHAVGTPFARLDGAIFKYNLPDDYIGLPLYFKFQSFNIWDGGLQDLSDCVEYAYVPGSSIPGVPTNLRSQFGTLEWKGSQLTIYVNSVPGATSYTWEIYDAPGTTLIRTLSSTLPSMSYNAADANSDGISRVYQVRARANRGTQAGFFSALVEFTNQAPPPVTVLTGIDGTSTGGVDFTLIASDDLAGYSIYYNDTAAFNPFEEGILLNNNGYTPHIIYGLPAGTYYLKIATYDNWSVNPELLNISAEISFTVSAGGGSSTPGGGGGGWCVVEDTPILLANEGGDDWGVYRMAKDLSVGDLLWTRHETTLAWGAYTVEAIQFEDSSDIWEYIQEGNVIKCTGEHRVWVNNQWVEVNKLGVFLGDEHRIAKITVTDAHTYISSGILSHNVKVPAMPEEP